jgi:hypothetical protein
MSHSVSSSGARVRTLTVFDDGGGPALYAGGIFTTAGSVAANCIANWDGSSWSALGTGLNSDVVALTVFDDGSGPALYAGGAFTIAGGVAANHIARWDGSGWSGVGGGMAGPYDPVVRALTVFDDGGGPALYAGGSFSTTGGVAASYIAKWDGSSWSALGSGLSGGSQDPGVYALAVFDDGGGPALYAGGKFTAAGGVAAADIAEWDGSSWSALGSGMGGGSTWHPGIYTLAVFDDGTGPALYGGGLFTTAGGVAANAIAKWDGSTWSALGSGMFGFSPWVQALAVFDDGSGPTLYAGGQFKKAGGVKVNNIAKWDGSSWSALGTGMDDWVTALQVYDDAGGSALYAGGPFRTAGGVAANHIAKWDGSSWSALGSGLNGGAWALSVYDDGSGPALYAGGYFSASPAGDSYLARWGGCPCAVSTYCTAGTSAAGCAALLASTGVPSVSAGSGFTIDASNVEGQQDGIFFYGFNGAQANPWGNGTSYQCVVPPLMRTPLMTASGTTGLCDGGFSLDFSAHWATAVPAKVPAAGQQVNVQLWYHDPASASNPSASLSDALEIIACP